MRDALQVRLGNYANPRVGAQANAALMITVAWRLKQADGKGPRGEEFFYHGASGGVGDQWRFCLKDLGKLPLLYLSTLLEELKTERRVMKEIERYLFW